MRNLLGPRRAIVNREPDRDALRTPPYLQLSEGKLTVFFDVNVPRRQVPGDPTAWRFVEGDLPPESPTPSIGALEELGSLGGTLPQGSSVPSIKDSNVNLDD